jgi:hypothetical protein
MSLGIFDDIESNSDEAIERLLKSLSETNETLYSEFESLVSTLEKTPAGLIKASPGNLRLIASFDGKFDAIIKTTPYYQESVNFIATYTDNSKLINKYFKAFEGFDPKNAIYETVIESNVEITVNSLLESGVNEYFKTPLINSLKQSMFEGTSKTDLLKSLRAELLGTVDRKPGLERYVKQVSTDAVNQFNGNYIGTISNDLGLAHYLWKGTKRADTRTICMKCAGKYMTEVQLRELINTESAGKGWPGMIPGTNFGNIMTRRGGYNCYHLIIPVSKAVYEAAKNKL